MANIHIAASGSNTSPYDTWAKAANSTTTAWANAITASAAGDDFYVDAAFTCSNASTQTFTFKGTAAAPNRVFSCTTITHDAPTTADLGKGANLTTTGASNLNLGGHVYFYGIKFNIGTGAGAALFNFASGGNFMLDNCEINMLATTNNNTVTGSGAASTLSRVILNNTPITFNGGAGGGINLSGGEFTWKNTASALPGSTTITNLLQTFARSGTVIFDGLDLSGSGKPTNLVYALPNSAIVQFINCKTGAAPGVTRPTVPGAFVDQIVTDSSATNYKQQRDTYSGTLTADTGVYNYATDGTTPIGWKIVATANCSPTIPFECFDIVQWVPAGTYAASSIMATSATASLTVADIWVDLEFLGSSYPQATAATSFGAGSGTALLPLIPSGTTPAALPTSGAVWGTGGVGNNYKVTIPSFTTSAAGYVRFKVRIGKASLTCYIDPAVTVA